MIDSQQLFLRLSHELRTPITLSLGSIESISRGRFGQVPDELIRQTDSLKDHQHAHLPLVQELASFSGSSIQ